jgi:AAA domain
MFTQVPTSHKSDLLRVSKSNPCPLCTKTDWCMVNEDGTVTICPRTDTAPTGWKRIKDTADGHGVYALETESDFQRQVSGRRPTKRTSKPKPAPIPAGSKLLRLPAPQRGPEPQKPTYIPKGVPASAVLIIYSYSDTQQVHRFEWLDPSNPKNPKGRAKTYRQSHINGEGEVKWEKGNSPWSAYRIEEVVETLKGVPDDEPFVVLMLEGEPNVELGRLHAIPALTLQGSSWDEAEITRAVEALQATGKNIVLAKLRDNDSTGVKKGSQIQSVCDRLQFPCIVIDPVAIYPDIPDKGDIKEVLDNMDADEFIRRLEEEIHRQAAASARAIELEAIEEEPSDKSPTDNSTFSKFSMLKEIAEQAREILRSKQDELTTNIKLEELRQAAGMGDYAWEHKIIKPLKRDMDTERFKLELLSLLQMEDPVERCLKISQIAPQYSMGAGQVKEAMAAMKQRTQAPQVEILTLDDLFASESEAIEWLVPGLLPVGETVLLCALPKVGKSKLAVDLSFCVATGESRFLGQETKQGKVLLITPDASKQSLKHELTKRGFRSQDAKNLHVIPRWSIDQMAVLEAELENFRPDLVIIDSLKKITAGKEISENSAEFADNIIALNDMLTRYRAAGILVHHANKGNDAIGVEKARGSTAIVGACWGMWMLDRIPKPDPNNAKKMIVDPKDPKRIFTATSRDSEGTTLSIEFNAENNSWDFMGEVGVDEAEAQQRQSHQERIMNILRTNSSRELSGSEIMELLEISKEQRNSIYVALGRMENKRLINVRPEPGDKRRSLYSLPIFNPTKETDHVTVKEKISLPPPPPTDTVSVVSCQSENHTEYGLDNNQHNNQHIPNNKSECGSVKNAESLTSNGINPIPNRLQLSGGGGGVKHNLEPSSVTVSTTELAQEQEPRSTVDANQSTAESIAPSLQFTIGERVKVSAQYPNSEEYKGELATIIEVWSDGLCRIELDREISVLEGKPKKQFNLDGRYLVLETASPIAPPESDLNEDELELVEFVRLAIAKNDPAAAKDVQGILAEVCSSGAADRSKVWGALTATEQAAFKALLAEFETLSGSEQLPIAPAPSDVEPQTPSEPHAPFESEPEQPHAPPGPPSKHKNFAVGDRVVVARDDGSMYEGAKGKVIKVKGQDVSIEFDKAVRGNNSATFNLASTTLMKL